MGNLIKAGRLFFAICIAGLAGQQLYFGDFRPVLVPAFARFPGEIVLVYLLSAALLAAAAAIMLDKHARTMSLLLGFVFLILFVFCQVPYELWVDPAGKSLGVWSGALKESALAGSAFIVAGSYPVAAGADGWGNGQERSGADPSWSKKPVLIATLEALIPVGPIFYSVTMIVFGIDHFLYEEFVQSLVPGWIPGALFWTYFAGAALIAAGVGIITRIQLRLAALLLGIAIFTWFIVLHIPRAVVAPVTDKGNELSSVSESLGFSGIAFLIAYSYAPWTVARKVKMLTS